MKHCFMVRPAGPTWTGLQALSELDQINSFNDHEKVIYFYRPRKSWLPPGDAISNTLRDPLGRVLVPFYPLAGRLRWILDKDQHCTSGRLELDCNGNGAEFFEAELDAELVEFGDLTPSTNYQYLSPFIDYSLPIHQVPLLSVQLTKFRCGAISLSLSFLHIVVDGRSFAHFLTEWGRFARGEPLSIMPFHDRNILQQKPQQKPQEMVDLHNDFIEFLQLQEKLPSADELNKIMSAEFKLTTISLRLSKDQVEILKNMACGKGRHRGNYTRFEVVAAHLWRCFTKLKSKNNKGGGEQTSTAAATMPNIFTTVDLRSHFKPALPVGYFGNAIFDVRGTSRAADLVLEPLAYGASRLREAIKKVTASEHYISSAINFIKNQQDMMRFRYFYSCFDENLLGNNPSLVVVNWVNLPLYGINFGWGNEIYFGGGYRNILDGDSVILRDISSNQQGSLLVLLCLQVENVAEFKMHFYKGLVKPSL